MAIAEQGVLPAMRDTAPIALGTRIEGGRLERLRPRVRNGRDLG